MDSVEHSEERERNLLQAAKEAGMNTLIWLTTQERIDSNGVLGQIWLALGIHGMRRVIGLA